MRHFSEVYRHLRRKNWRQYALLAGCTFFSVLLITAYACMMRSPTVLTILPEGGDSRKQVMMVFVLAVLGCAVFTTYASGLFFRQKSREIGTFLALGATRHQLKTELSKELALLSLGSCAAGALLGVPLAGDEKPDLSTTKKDKTAHGFGLLGMREIAKRYGGSFEVVAANGRFELVVCLPL